MGKSLLFLPDISGFTEFVQTTEVEHSQHVISELLEVLIAANTEELQLAEIEGDALFFYKENEIPSLEKLLALSEHIFTAFYSHLKLLEKNRICPCNACSTAPKLQLKIIAHCGELQFLTVQNNRKPFGKQVIEAHRLMKNSVDSDNYVLFSKELTDTIGLSGNYQSKLYNFKKGNDRYDGNQLDYLFSVIDNSHLKLKSFLTPSKVVFNKPPSFIIEKEFPVAAVELLEALTNYTYRRAWKEDVNEIKYHVNEVTRLGSEHVCVVNQKHLDFVVVTKEAKSGQLVYGEMTESPIPVDKLYQFYVITPLGSGKCKLVLETYLEAKSPIKKLAIFLVVKKVLKKDVAKGIDKLYEFLKSKSAI
ncbi:DUF2652 domain-containing protein [Polaribacter sp. L3A8]|uniref:DUF2652 domain-containing protein n=1 Tax=Polaribacter sp. L3A8 TaxID=2686361 RepID=UPI00131A64CB|nr:DUF2652 domain-containing protein [Polaribacter sp. L3A8]